MKRLILIMVVAMLAVVATVATTSDGGFSCFGIAADDSMVCAEHGVCTDQDMCECEEGYEGEQCDQCAPDYYGFPACTYCSSSDTCSGNGDCDDSGLCMCYDGWEGDDCAMESSADDDGDGYDTSVDCDDSDEQINPGAEEVCDEQDNDCDDEVDEGCVLCNGILQDDPSVCSGQGTCVADDVCECYEGYEGGDCEEEVWSCDGIAYTDAEVCGGKGECVDWDTCECVENYQGEFCGTYVATPECYFLLANDPNVCSGKGTCVDWDTCECYEGYEGENCECLPADEDLDGFSSADACGGSQDDCDDADDSVFPGGVELCDGKDNDCDGEVDEGACDGDGDGFPASEDCDDTNASIFPGAPDSVCDGVDNDCDDLADEDFNTTVTTCGVGVCAASGLSVCVNASVVDACEPGLPSDEVCDNLDNDCDGRTDEEGVCDVDCEVSDWSEWTECSEECGGGEQTRTRTVTTEPEYGGEECPSLTDVQSCNEEPCPVDCEVGEWGGWGECSAECDGGEQERTRPVLVEPAYGGEECPSLTDVQSCNEEPCFADEDGDGVPDDEDKCLGSTYWTASKRLLPNHYDSSNWPAGPDNYGCSCEQVLYCKPGWDSGELKYGCTAGTKWIWEEQKSWALDCQVDGIVTEGSVERFIKNVKKRLISWGR